MNTDNWTLEDYKAFAMIYAAYVDGTFHEEELEMIIGKVGDERAHRIPGAHF